MNTTTITPVSKKKKIDLDEDHEDAGLYAKLSKEHPEGLVPVSKEEQEDFEKWLGV